MKTGGLDIGTTGCKITVFSENWDIIDKEYKAYDRNEGDVFEIDGNSLKAAVLEVVSKAAKKYPDLAAIGITSFGESFVLADEDGNPLFPIMIYTDKRGRKEADELIKKIGDRKIAAITGLAPHGMYSLPKAMWIKRNKPEIFAKAKHIFLIQDFVAFILTGQAKMDYSLATRTMAFDIRQLCWSDELLTASGISKSLFSKLVPPGTIVGEVTEKARNATGLAAGVKIIAVSHDQVAAATGAGAFKVGDAVDGAGTVQCLTPVFKKIPTTPDFEKNRFNVVPYIISGTYVSYAFTYTGGALLQWCADTLGKDEKDLALKKNMSVHQYLQSFYKGPTGLLVLPHFAGAATPYMDEGSKGAIVGLTEATTVADIYLGAMEGVCYEMRLNKELIEKDGIKIKRIVATGGGAKSPLYLQMKADILNTPIEVLASEEAGTIGCAMAIGVCLKYFQSYDEAAEKLVKIVKTVKPNPDRVKAYNEIYQRYKKLYKAVRPLV